jgi:uncharacterized protein YycO
VKKIKLLFAAFILCGAHLLTSCSAVTHTVGTGGKGNGKPGQYDVKKKQWYILFGAVPLNKVDSKDLAGGAQNYTVRTTHSFGDILIGAVGSYFLGIKTQTVRVSKGNP